MSKCVGMGDDLNILQKTIENSNVSSKPILSILVISPLFGVKYNEYSNALERLIFIRKESQVLHKNIEFLLLDLVSNQYIFIKLGTMTKVDIEENQCDHIINKIYKHVLMFIDRYKHLIYISEFFLENKEILQNPNINLSDIRHESNGTLYFNFQQYLIDLRKQKQFFPYDVQIEHMYENKNNLIFESDGRPPAKLTFAEWPIPNHQLAISTGNLMLKLGFKKCMQEYNFLSTLIDNHKWNVIPYDIFPFEKSLGFNETFNVIRSSKLIIGPEGGIRHLARMLGTPFVLIIPKMLDFHIKNTETLRKVFYHWEQDNYYLAPTKHNAKKPSYFMFEKDLESNKVQHLINSIENFVASQTHQKIYFFTLDANDTQCCTLVRQFCKTYDFTYGIDVQIYK